MAHSSEVPKLDTLRDLLGAAPVSGERPAVLQFREATCDTVSRARLDERASDLVKRLRVLGIGEQERVAVCGPTSTDWMTAALAVLRSGAILIPIDAQMPPADLEWVLNDSLPAVLLTDEDHHRRLEQLDLTQPPSVRPLDTAAWPNDPGDENPAPLDVPGAANPDAEAVLFYTSGTTGRPKGVPLRHAQLAFQVNAIAATDLATSEDRLLLPLPLHHEYPFVVGMLAPLTIGAPIVIPAGLTGPQLLQAIREGEASVLVGVPRLYRALDEGIRARAASRGRTAGWLMSKAVNVSRSLNEHLRLSVGRWLLRSMHQRVGEHLRLMASGGAALDPDLGRRLEAMGWGVAVGYGLTETSPLLTIRRPRIGPLESVGQPIPGVEIRVTSEDSAEAAGQSGSAFTTDEGEGEILARGPGVFHGYRHQDDATAEAFPEDGWFRTGDLGRFDQDGFLYITGRKSTRMVTESGENLQPDRLEDAYGRHPLIDEIGVLQKDRQLVGLVVADAEELRRRGEADPRQAISRAIDECARSLPSPARLTEFRLTRRALPRTRLGKIRRHLLENRYQEAAAARDAPSGGPVSDRDLSDEDQALLQHERARDVWDMLCERYPDRGLRPDSRPQLDLGIDSMEWLNLTLDIRERTGVEIHSDAIARIAVIRDLLQQVIESETESANGVDPVDAPLDVLSRRQQRWLQPLGPAMHGLSLAAYWTAAGLLRTLCEVRVTGRDQVPEDRACVLAPNHTSYLDPFAVGYALGPASLSRTYWVGMTTAAFDTPAKRFGSRLGRGLPINPRHGAVSGLAYAAAILQRDQRLVWFPEGRRSVDGRLLDFKPGLGSVLDRIPVPVVPVWIDGAHQAWPVRRRLPRRGTVSVIFGAPVSVDTLKSLGEGEGSPEKQILDGLRQRITDLRPS